MRNYTVAALVLAATACLARPAPAQDTRATSDRTGWWFSYGMGGGRYSMDCTRCGSNFQEDPWRSGSTMTGEAVLGVAVSKSVRAGLHFTIWSNEKVDAEGGERVAEYVSFIPAVQVYPIAGSNLFVRTGVGLSILSARSPLENTGSLGMGIEALVGHDFWFARSWAVAPYAGLSLQRFTTNIMSGDYPGNATLWKLGVAVAIY